MPIKHLFWIPLVALALLATPLLVRADDNLLKHADFEMKDGKIVGWTDRTKPKQTVSVDADAGHADGKAAMRVDVAVDGGKTHGQIIQTAPVKANTTYRIEGDVKGGNEGMAYFSIKLMAGKTEGERFSTPTNKKTGQWETVSKEFTTDGQTTAVQVLCRFRMSSAYVEKSAWFANVKLTQVGEGGGDAAADSGGEAEVGQVHQPAQASPQAATNVAASFPNLVRDADVYVTAGGAGDQSGRDWANALPASGGGLQAAWDAAGPGRTVHVGSGTYENVKLVIRPVAGDEPRVLTGVDTGEGLPLFRGVWSKDQPEKNFGPIIASLPDAHHWTVRDLRMEDVGTAVKVAGPNSHVEILNIDVTRTRDAFVLYGGGEGRETTHVLVRDCDVQYYTKRTMRFRYAVAHARIENCHGDAGGKEWAVERFAIGFSVMAGKDGANHDIAFVNCSARNNYDPNGSKYWNGDGFCAERDNYNLSYTNCRSFDNTDGGWDDKSTAPRFVNCVGMRNKRNFRLWAGPEPAVVINCISGYATPYGSGGAIGLWVAKNGAARIERSTFVANPSSISVDSGGDAPGPVIVDNCIVYAPDAKSLYGGELTRLERHNTIDDPAKDPGFADNRREWDGGDTAFDSSAFPTKGYRHGATAP